MNYLAFLEWAAENASDAAELVDGWKKITPPAPGNYVAFVESSRDFETRLAHLADTFPVAALAQLKSHHQRARIEAAHSVLTAFGGGAFVSDLEKIAQLALQAWALWNQFKPV
ncbi:MAG TPA: hypothetical protein VGI40_01715 [Pirellulaceae bacterium]